MKGIGLIFGLNYKHCAQGQLDGCINDAKLIKQFLESCLKIKCKIFTDDIDLKSTSGIGILSILYETAVLSKKNNLDFVWIHYSGHGSYVPDTNLDEDDGLDECLVPSDYETNGMVVDDHICSVLSHFNKHTKVVCVFDCCHSGTMADLKYSWDNRTPTIENFTCDIGAKIITISGCLDNQESIDTYSFFDVQYSGVLTKSIVDVLTNHPTNDIFELMNLLKRKIKEQGAEQIPKLCSTYDIRLDPHFPFHFVQ
jgi:hypothetical protein